MKMNKILTFIFCVLFSFHVFAEQWEWLLKEQAVAAVKLTSNQKKSHKVLQAVSR